LLNSLLFGATTFVSAYTLTYWKFHGSLPGYDNRKIRGGDSNIDPDKAAFSMAPHDEEAYERVNVDDQENNGYSDARRYGHANPHGHDDDDPDRYGALPPRHSELFNQETDYGSGGAGPATDHSYGSQLSYNDEPAQFPVGNYDRVTH
jgi:hypothetical protein